MLRKVLVLSLFLTGCATYNYAQNVKQVSFSDDVSKGKSVGNVRGEDCTWQILGYQMGGVPTVDRAFNHAKNGTDGASLVGSMDTHQKGNGSLRYINNVNTANTGFNAGLFGKSCITVTGVGYQ